MIDASVVIAYRDLGCPHRRRSFEWIHRFYGERFAEVIVEAGDDTFTRSRGINAGVRRATRDVIVQADPDSFTSYDALDLAVDLAASPGLVVPHSRYLYLTEEATAAFLDGVRSLGALGPEDCTDFGTHSCGNVVVFSRETWERAGGFDERFGLWGGDDGAFAYAAEAYTRPIRRLGGDVIHLWHPRLPQSVPGSVGFVEQFTLLAEYRDAAELGPEAVRAYVAESRAGAA